MGVPTNPRQHRRGRVFDRGRCRAVSDHHVMGPASIGVAGLFWVAGALLLIIISSLYPRLPATRGRGFDWGRWECSLIGKLTQRGCRYRRGRVVCVTGALLFPIIALKGTSLVATV